MSTITVKESHSLSIEQLKSKLKPFEDEIANRFGMKIKWSGDRADLKGTGASGEVKVTNSDVTITVKLGMLAKAAGVKADLVEQSISKRLKETLAA